MSVKRLDFTKLAISPECWEDYYQPLRRINEGAGGGELAGKLFEEFCYYFFKTDPVHRGLYKEVYREKDIPLSIKSKLSLASRDHGVDLLLLDKRDRLIAVQCKFKSDEMSQLSWSGDKLANAVAEASHAFGLIIMTNATGIDRHTESKGFKLFKQFGVISNSHLSAIDATTVQNICRISKGDKPQRSEPAKPRDYQARAVRSIIAGLENHDRGQLILPCGAGKTLVALWAMEQLDSKHTLVMAPSLALLRQTMEEWAKHQRNWINYICVCSDQGIDSSVENDSIVGHSYELPTVTTDPKDLRAFLQLPGRKIVYATYQSSEVVRSALRNTKIGFDLAFCDEAHKTTGDRNSYFGLVHEDSNIRIKKRVYMTATPRVLAEQIKTKLGDKAKYLADMSDIKTFGPELFLPRMSFAQAIKEKILCDYKIIAIGISDREIQQQIDRYVKKGRTVGDIASNLALQKVMNKYKAQHTITFHATIQRAKDFSDNHQKMFPSVHSELVTGEQPTSYRRKLLKDFVNSPKAVLSNARCLTEGVDVPAIDCVFFCDPRRSKIDIVQATGRALRRSPHKSKPFGYIVVPIYHGDRGKLEDAIDQSRFKDLVAVVRSLADQDERLALEIAKVKLGDTSSRADSHIQIDLGEMLSSKNIFTPERIHKHIFDQVVEKSVSRWDVMIAMLKEFKREFKLANPTSDAPLKWRELVRWSNALRQKGARASLTPERLTELNNLGFDWRIEGVTLESTTGLLYESQFARHAGFSISAVCNFRKRGILKPVGKAPAINGVKYFYRPSQAQELKKKLGITLDSTEGLTNETEFAKLCGTGSATIARYRESEIIDAAGKAMSGHSVGFYYHPSQLNKLNEHLGITLKATEGLLTENAFAKHFGVSVYTMKSYREKGLVVPIGKGRRKNSIAVVFFYQASQARDLKQALSSQGRKSEVKKHPESEFPYLSSTAGLLSENQFAKKFGFSSIRRYRALGTIRPVGVAVGPSGLNYFYRPKQAKELREKLGITLGTTKGLMNERAFAKHCKVSQGSIQNWRKAGKIKPVGRAISTATLAFFYRPEQRKEVMQLREMPTHSENGLISESDFARYCKLSRISDYRRKGLIKPVGKILVHGHVTYGYKAQQKNGLLRKLGITLRNTNALLNETQFAKVFGISGGAIARYRQKGLLKPVGKAMAGSGVGFYYRKTQLAHLRKRLGITLTNTKGLLNESEFRELSGLTNIARYRKRGLIRPRGAAMSGPNVGYFYHPSQVRALKRRLGINLRSIKGLIPESQFGKQLLGVSNGTIVRYREQRLITPVGRAMGDGKISYFYRRNQAMSLKKKLGITLNSTKGLLTETDFAAYCGLSDVGRYRKRGIITPYGRAITNAGLAFYYRREQSVELKNKLEINLQRTAGLVNELQFAKRCGISLKALVRYRNRGLLRPVGKGTTRSGCSFFYRPEQVAILKRTLNISRSTKGLISERELARRLGISNVSRYRVKGLIKPKRTPKDTLSRSYFYCARQADELRKKLGITLKSTKNLLSENQFAEAAEISRSAIAKYRKQRIVKPVGVGPGTSKPSFYYRRKQVEQLKRKLGITIPGLRGFLKEGAFAKLVGFSTASIRNFRMKGILKPAGQALGNAGATFYYKPEQAKELRKKLGITLNSIRGLLNQYEFSKHIGMSNHTVDRYRKQGLIKPVGRAMSGGPGVGFYYRPGQAQELREKLGITLANTKGLLSEKLLTKLTGLNIASFREKGMIIPVGTGIGGGRITVFYKAHQVKGLAINQNCKTLTRSAKT